MQEGGGGGGGEKLGKSAYHVPLEAGVDLE